MRTQMNMRREKRRGMMTVVMRMFLGKESIQDGADRP
jgi:hypothetical protein